MKVIILSLDYDDCGDNIFYCNGVYIGKIDFNNINIQFILTAAANPDVALIIIEVGSLRQDITLDNFNSDTYSKGSCFKNYILLQEELRKKAGNNKIIFRPLLLADVVHGLEPGTAMNDSQYKAPEDTYKPRIVFAQFHDAIDYIFNELKYDKETQVDFRLIDDRSILDASHPQREERDITGRLIHLFKNNPYLVPANLKFSTYFYAGHHSGHSIYKHGETVEGKGLVIERSQLKYIINEHLSLAPTDNALSDFKIMAFSFGKLNEKYKALKEELTTAVSSAGSFSYSLCLKLQKSLQVINIKTLLSPLHNQSYEMLMVTVDTTLKSQFSDEEKLKKIVAHIKGHMSTIQRETRPSESNPPFFVTSPGIIYAYQEILSSLSNQFIMDITEVKIELLEKKEMPVTTLKW